MAQNTVTTTAIQRALLKILSSNKLELQKQAHSVKEDWFDSPARKYIFTKVIENYNKNKSHYSDVLFQFDIANEGYGESTPEHISIVGEWNHIQGANGQESSDSLINRLIDKAAKDNFQKTLFDTVTALQSGADVYKIAEGLIPKLVSVGRKEEIPSADTSNFDDLILNIKDKILNPDKYAGIKTGFPIYDNQTGGLHPAELVLFAAISGVGKSTMMRQIAFNIAQNSMKNILFITNEEARDEQRRKLLSLKTEIQEKVLKNPNGNMTDKIYEELLKKNEEIKRDQHNHGKLIVHELIPHVDTVASIEKKYMELQQQGIKIDIVFIDYLDHMKPMEVSEDDNAKQANIAAEAKGLALHCRIPVVSNTQVATDALKKQEKGKKFNKFDIFGSKRKVHVCSVLAYIRDDGTRVQEQLKSNGGDRETEEECDRILCVDIAKNRAGAYFSYKIRHFVQIGKMETLTDLTATPNGQAKQEEIDRELSTGNLKRKLQEELAINEVDDAVSPEEEETEKMVIDNAIQIFKKQDSGFKFPRNFSTEIKQEQEMSPKEFLDTCEKKFAEGQNFDAQNLPKIP